MLLRYRAGSHVRVPHQGISARFMQPTSVPVPAAAPRFLRLVRAHLKHPEIFRCETETIFGAWTHFAGGRTYLCEHEWGVCPAQLHAHRTQWKGYLLGFSMTHQGPALLELPPEAVRSHACFGPAVPSLVGARLQLVRVGPHANSEVSVLCQYAAFKRVRLRQPEEVLYALRTLLARWTGQLGPRPAPQAPPDDVSEVPL